jgi:hypothetical protein
VDTTTGADGSQSTQVTDTDAPAQVPTYNFTLSEWAELYALRERYEQSRDLFSAREQERLRFMRWLYETGRLEA